MIPAVSADDSPDTFTDLQKIVDKSNENSVIELNNDYSNDKSKEITISKSVTINGNNHILDGKKKSNIITITDDADEVRLNDIVFKNGLNSFGGAVYQDNTKELIINNCTFIDNVGFDGGAVNVANAKINNCTFINNIGYNGGAVCQEYSTLTNSKFISNYGYVGGAVESVRESKIVNCEFTDNAAVLYGGAVTQYENSEIVYSTFSANKAPSGGAVESFNSKILNSKFDYNNDDVLKKSDFNSKFPSSWFSKSDRYDLPSKNTGGAIYAENSVIYNNTFKNHASKNSSEDAINGKNNTFDYDFNADDYKEYLSDDYLKENYPQNSNIDEKTEHNVLKEKTMSAGLSKTAGNPIVLLLICLMIPVLNLRKIRK